MKKLLLFFTGAFLTIACSGELCFECSKSSGNNSSKQGMCGDRSDAKDFKKKMEKQGYKCRKVKE